MNNFKTHLLLAASIVMAGCASAPQMKQDSLGRFNGVEGRSLAASIEILAGNEAPKDHDKTADVSSRQFEAAAARTTITTGMGAATSGFTGSAMAFGLAGGVLTLLGPDDKPMKHYSVTIVKLDNNEPANSEENVRHALRLSFIDPVEKDLTSYSADGDDLTLLDPNSHASISVAVTKNVSPDLVKRIQPFVYRGDGRYVAYAFTFGYHLSGFMETKYHTEPYLNITNQVLIRNPHSWRIYDFNKRSGLEITYIKPKDGDRTIVKEFKVKDELYNSNGRIKIDTFAPNCADARKTIYTLR